MADEDPIDYEVRFSADAGSADDAGDVLAKAMRDGLELFFNDFGKNLRKELQTGIAAGLRDVNAAQEKVKRTADDTAAAFRKTTIYSEQLEKDMTALRDRAEGFRKTLSAAGVDSGLTEGVTRSFERIVRLQREFEDDQERIAKDSNVRKVYEDRYNQIRTGFSQDVGAMQSILKKLTAETEKEAKLQTVTVAEEMRRQTAERKAQLTQQNIEASRASNREIAIIKQANAEKLAADRATARTRIETMRFVFAQIRVFERGIAATVRGTSAAVGGLVAATAAGARGVASIFQRNNRQVDDGLGAALNRRESLFRSSFAQQEAILSRSALRQEAILNRLEQRTSRGVIGAATGRSRLGGLVGGGLAIGGGFAFINKLREGYKESVSLTEALNAIRVIAGDAAQSMIDFADQSVARLFLTKSAALEAQIGFAAFGKSAGVQGQELATFSNTLTQLATDLASFRDTDVETAITSITAALAGETESIRRNYSVLLNEATLQQRAFTEGITDTIRVLQPQERVLATYAEILAQTTDAQNDSARTAKDLANASRQLGASITQLFATVIGKAKPLATTIVNFLNPAFAELNTLLEGEVSPALRTFGIAAAGAAAGLAGFLVIKTVIESVRLLGTALTFALTPMGAVATILLAAGAAIAVFSERSERFRTTMIQIAGIAAGVLVKGFELAQAGIGRFVTFLGDTVIPVVARFATAVGGQIVFGLRVAVAVVDQVVLPAFGRFVDIIEDDVIPAVADAAGAIRQYLIPAAVTLGAVWLIATAPVTTLVTALLAVGATAVLLRTDFAGTVRSILGSVGELAEGIGTQLAGVGRAIFNAITPLAASAVASISEAFGRIDLRAVALGVLEAVRVVGFVLGSIVSDPLFIQAVEGIALAAVAVGAKFVQGFIQGVIENLPDLYQLLREQLSLVVEGAIKFAFSNPQILAAAALALFTASVVRSAFRAGGGAAGAEAAGGMARQFGRGISSFASQQQNLLLGFFGGAAGLQRQADATAKLAKTQIVQSFQQTNRQLRALGQEVPFLLPKGGITQQALDEVNERLRTTKERFGEAGSAAAIFRFSATAAFRELGTIVRGTMTAVTLRTTAGFGEMATAAQRFKLFAGDAFRSLQGQGLAVGQAVGGTLLAGFAAAMAGQQLGQATSASGAIGGIAGILGAALTAGLVTGNIAVAAGVAALGGTVALLSAAFRDNDDAAREAASAIDRYAASIGNANTVAEAVLAFSEEVADELLGLSATAQRVLDVNTFDVKAFVDATLGGADQLAAISAGFNGLDFNTIFGDLKEGKEINEALAASYDAILGGVKELALRKDILASATAALAAEQEKEAAAGDTAATTYEDIAARVQEAFTIFDDLELPEFDIGSLRDMEAEIDEIFKQIGVDFDFDFENGSIEEFKYEVFDALPALSELTEEAKEFSVSVDLIGSAIRELDSQRTSSINREIDGLRDRLEGAEDAANRAREALTSFITGRYADTPQALVDNLIGNLGSIGSQIEEGVLQGGIRGDALVRSAVGGLDTELAQIIQAGFDAGLRTQEQFQALLAPLFAAVNEETGDAAARILSTIDFEFGISPQAGGELQAALQNALQGREIETRATAIFNADAEVAAIQRQLDAFQGQLDVEVVFSAEQIEAKLREAGANAQLLAELDFTNAVRNQTDPLAGQVADASAAQQQFIIEQQNTIIIEGSSSPEQTASEAVQAASAAAGRPFAVNTGTRFIRPV